MQVFKAYFKIIKKNIPMLTVYFVVFFGVSIIFVLSNQTSGLQGFTESKCKVALIVDDTDSVLVNGFVDYINERSRPVAVEDDKESMQDALFFREAEYIIRIPEGFTESFMSGKEAVLEKTSIPDSASTVFVDMMVDNFLSSSALYVKYQPDITQAEVVEKVVSDLSKEAPVTYSDYSTGENVGNISFFFNFAFYTSMIIMVIGVTSVMMVFNNAIIRQRTLCSPIRPKRIGFETLAANLIFALVVWLINMLISIAMCGDDIISVNGLLWAINLLLITIVCLSISFLVGNLIKGKSAQSAVANTLALGMSFVSGAFVPQVLLGQAVLSFAKFLPSYWYIKASDAIGGLKVITRGSLNEIIICFLIQLGFAVAIISVALVISRQRRPNAMA